MSIFHSIPLGVVSSSPSWTPPKSLTLALIAGGVRITWKDGSSKTEFIEIYANIANSGYFLLTTIAAGVQTYDLTIGGAFNVKVKIRGKKGTPATYTDYTSVSETTTAYTPNYYSIESKGNRTSLITITTDCSVHGDINTWVNGNTTENLVYFNTAFDCTGKYIRYDFGVGASKILNEVIWYQKNEVGHNIHGNWKWQGSNNGTSWVDIGNPFEWGTTATQTLNSMAANTTGYRYYQMVGVSGNVSDFPYLREIEFKICNATGVQHIVHYEGDSISFLSLDKMKLGVYAIAVPNAPLVQEISGTSTGGSKIADIITRSDDNTIPNSELTDICLIVGINDCEAYYAQEVATQRANFAARLESLYTKLKAKNHFTNIFIANVGELYEAYVPLPTYQYELDAIPFHYIYNEEIVTFAANHSADVHVVNIQTVLDGATAGNYSAADGLHPSDTGKLAIANLFMAAINTLYA